MNGQPVWLASVSYSKKSRIVATGNWPKFRFRRAERLAHRILFGVGDDEKERGFRMNITFCVHRALSESEKDQLPSEWQGAPGGLAGGPVEVLFSRGIETTQAALPCTDPSRDIIDSTRPDLWFPIDCGICYPCEARLVCRE